MESSKISTKIKKIDRLIIITSALILLALAIFNFTDFDLALQKYLFDFNTKTWLIDRDEPIKKFFFYRLPKYFFGAFGLVCLVAAWIGFDNTEIRNSQRRHPELVSGSILTRHRHKFLLILLGLIFIPLTAGNIKKFTNIYCPNQLQIYGGKYPYVKILEAYPQDFHQEKRGVCFPAGHAVTGFALLILFFAFEKKSHKLLGLFTALFFGWLLGFYQMAKGAHFISDTVLAMLASFLVAAIIARFYELRLAKRSR